MVSPDDSPLSIAGNVAGLVTLVFAIAAAAYVRFTYLRNSDTEYFRVEASLSWYKTESAWLTELLASTSRTPDVRLQPEYHMYSFVMDDIIKLEQRILELVAETEKRAAEGARDEEGGRWTTVPRGWGFTTEVALAWLPVRTKALELVRQRDALTGRVQFTQMSMISSRIRELELSTRWLESKTDERLGKMEAELAGQREQVGRLEELVFRLTHRHRLSQGMEQAITEAEAVRKRRVSVDSRQSPSPTSPATATRRKSWIGRRLSVTSRRRSLSR